MKLTPVFVGLSLALAAQASWFGSDKSKTDSAVLPYTTWSAAQLRDWLDAHAVTVPQRTPSETELRALVESNWHSAAAWTYDQYASAQKSFQDLRDSSFDAWDESRLREFLLQQGVVSPKGPREKLVLMAKEKYRQYGNAASSFSSQASASASSLSSQASASASTAVYGDKKYQASKSVSSVVAKATSPAVAAFDESKDYVYSTWDDNQMRSWLEEKGLLKTKQQKKRDELLQMMHDAYGKAVNPVWQAWSDSYIVRYFSHLVYEYDADSCFSIHGSSPTISSSPMRRRVASTTTS